MQGKRIFGDIFTKIPLQIEFYRAMLEIHKTDLPPFPTFLKEADLEANLLEALELVPLTSMWLFGIFFST